MKISEHYASTNTKVGLVVKVGIGLSGNMLQTRSNDYNEKENFTAQKTSSIIQDSAQIGLILREEVRKGGQYSYDPSFWGLGYTFFIK